MNGATTCLLLSALLLTACADDPYRALYDGNKNRIEAMRTPGERAVAPIRDYDSYKKERERQE